MEVIRVRWGWAWGRAKSSCGRGTEGVMHSECGEDEE